MEVGERLREAGGAEWVCGVGIGVLSFVFITIVLDS